MNVYFIDPTYVKPEGWKPLLTYLKVKAAYSFIPRKDLSDELLLIIKPFLKAAYSTGDIKQFADNCVFWLRSHFEKHIRLITDDYPDIDTIPKEERKKYSSRSAYNNLKYLDDENCLILLKLVSFYDYAGNITAPKCPLNILDNSQTSIDLPTHISSYCQNILHKKYGHNQYQNQSAFIMFDEFFSEAYFYLPIQREWCDYRLNSKRAGLTNFMKCVNRAIKDLSPQNFPLIDVDGKKYFTLLRTSEGDKLFKQLLDEAKKAEIENEKQWEDSGLDMDSIAKEWADDFWRECGESGSNCESWPGWG